jgi:hypothetical protein
LAQLRDEFPKLSVKVRVGVEQLSVAEAHPVFAGRELSLHLIAMLDGIVNTGFLLSVMVTLKEQLAVFPDASVTWKVFVVVPRGKTEPDANPVVRTVFAPAQLSVPTGAV